METVTPKVGGADQGVGLARRRVGSGFRKIVGGMVVGLSKSGTNIASPQLKPA